MSTARGLAAPGSGGVGLSSSASGSGYGPLVASTRARQSSASAAGVSSQPSGGLTGLYLHVPFCAARCHYCDFNTYAGMDELMPRYVAALRADLARAAEAGPRGVAPGGTEVGPDWPVFTSIFVGGGTPTLLPAEDLAGLLRLARELLPVTEDAEVTVEANPETVTIEYISVLVSAGVNRVSMGAQSFAPHVLAALGRWHDADRPLRAVADARSAGISHINLDLIYGTPGESDDDWIATLDAALSARVDHVSAYALTVEPGAEYAGRIRRGEAIPPDDDVLAARMEIADGRLSEAGLQRYEISNWARPGRECRHNLTYWEGGDWLGAGAGAHGHWAGRRWWTLRSPARYCDAALGGHSTQAGEEVPDDAGRRLERLMLGLRMTVGVERSRVEPIDDQEAARLAQSGLLSDDGGRLKLTPAGMLVANEVIVRLAA
ncbi:MAG TPA: radical SAM family heme chaperone HemW [Egibacteraceae bacterium]|nr:radical SAM family heme chaperone HemW [Egibacteraceae bacterium]